jgi:hypothetical protein
MDEGAVGHGCGWRAPVPHTRGVEVIPASAEVARAAIARAREYLTRVSGKPDRKASAERVSLLSDVGHGGECSCEVCCGERERRRVLREKFPVV